MTKSRKSAAVIMVVIAVASSLGIGFVYYSRTAQPDRGPPVSVSAMITGANSAPFASRRSFTIDMSNISAAIFSPIPSSLNSSEAFNISGLNQMKNPYEVKLFQGTANREGQVNGYLSSEFYKIVREWKSMISPGSENESMMLYASLTYVLNGSFYVYSYYNNIEFNPGGLQYTYPGPSFLYPGYQSFSQFNTVAFFNMSHPAEIIPLNSSKVTESTTAGTNQFTTVYDRTVSAPLPLIAVSIDLASESQIEYFFQYGFFSQFSMNSVSLNMNQNAALMSTTPSWSGGQSTFFQEAKMGTTVPVSNQNVSMIYIGGVKIHVVDTKIIYSCTLGSKHYSINGGHSVSIAVTAINGNNMNLKSTYLSEIANSPYWYTIFNALGQKNASKNSVQLSQGQSFRMTSSSSGLGGPIQAEIGSVKATSSLYTAIGEGLAIATAARVIADASSPENALQLTNSELAPSTLNLSMLSAFSSISYMTGHPSPIFNLQFNNLPILGLGSSLNMSLYRSAWKTEINNNGTLNTENISIPYISASPL